MTRSLAIVEKDYWNSFKYISIKKISIFYNTPYVFFFFRLIIDYKPFVILNKVFLFNLAYSTFSL